MANSAVVGLLRILLTANTAEFETAMGRASDEAKKWSKEFRKVGAQATAVGSALTKAVTVPIVGLGAAAIKAASDFESSFAGVRKTVNATEEQFAEMAAGLRAMSKEIPTSVDELNKIAEAAGQLGIKREDILQFTRVMADLGVTTNLTSDEAASMTAQFQNIFGAAGKDVDRFGSTIVALGNASATTEKDILEMGLRIAGAGNQVGLSQGQVLGFAAALSSVGINAEAGGSAISRAFLKMNDAVADGGAKLEEFARVAGKPVAEFAELFRTNAAEAMRLFIAGLARVKSEGENVNGTLEGLLGKNILIKDTLLRAAGAGDLLGRSLELQGKAWKENTALTKEAEERYKTFESTLKTVWNQANEVAITFGLSLLPVVKDLVTAITPLISGVGKLAELFAKLPEPVRLAALGVAAVAAAAGPAFWAVGQLATNAGLLIGAFKQGGILMRAAQWINGISIAGYGAAASLGGVAIAAASLYKVIEAGSAAWGLYKDRQEQARLAIEQNKSHTLALEAASKVAGRSITDLAEALRILQADAARQRAEQDAAAASGAKAAAATGEQAAAVKGLRAELNAARLDAGAFTAAQREEIKAGLELGKSHKEIAEALEVSEAAVDLYADRLKALEAQHKKNTKAAEEFAESVSFKPGNIWVPFAAGLKDTETTANAAGESIYNLATGSLAEAGAEFARGRAELEAWANQTGAVLPPAIKATGAALDDAADSAGKFRSTISAALKDLPNVIMGAIKGGGNVGSAIGGLFGSSIFGAESNLVKGASGMLSKALGKTIGGAIGSIIPGLGTLLGAGLGKMAGAAFGKLFKSEGKKVNDLRDAAFASAGGFEALHQKLNAAGFSMERLLKVSKVADWEREWSAAQQALSGYQAELEATSQSFGELVESAGAFGPAALESFGPAVEELARMGKISGANLEMFRALADGSRVDFEKMEAQANKYGISLDALGPRFKGAKIGATAADIINTFTELEAQSADVGGLLSGMKDEIAAVVKQAIAAGTELPAQMKPWIEQLQASGDLVDENGKALEGLEGLKFGEPIKTEMQKVIEKLQELIDKITGGLVGAIEKLPATVPIKFEGDFDWRNAPPEALGGSFPAMAEGGIIRRPTLVLAGEAGAEAIVPLDKAGEMLAPAGAADPRLREELSGLRRDMRSMLEGLKSTLAVALRDAAMGRV